MAVDPLLKGVREKIGGEYLTSDHIYGGLSQEVGRSDGPEAGDTHSGGSLRCSLGCAWSRLQRGDVVNVVGTSTCIIAIAQSRACAGCLRCCAGERQSRADRNRSWHRP